MTEGKTVSSGNIYMLLLQLLSEKDMYGYEMIEALREKSNNVFELKAGTLYPLLHGMEEKGYLGSYGRNCSSFSFLRSWQCCHLSISKKIT